MDELTIFTAAVSLPPEERSGFLAKQCGDDRKLRKHIEALLRAHDDDDNFLDHGPPASITATCDSDSNGAGEAPLKVLGDFTLLRELGRGGMGIVYEARQTSLNRVVALKVLSARLGITHSGKARFLREAEAAARLHHTNIVPVYATGEADGYHFYAMELVDGPSLDQVIRAARSEQPASGRATVDGDAKLPSWAVEKLPLPTASSASDVIDGGSSTPGTTDERFRKLAEMMAEVADALEHARQRSVIHRDIKPSNLLLSADGHLSLTDFGLARILDQPGVTMTGEFVGSPLYMSPEQIAAGRVPIDHRTDVYSLGATLYELLTLCPPFPGDTRESVIAQILQKEVQRPRRISKKIPVELESICLKALEKDPDQRYQTAGELAADLQRYVNGYAIQARRPNLVRSTVKFVKRNKKTVIGAAAVACFALIALLTTVWYVDSVAEAKRLEARTELPGIDRLVSEEHYFDAWTDLLEKERIIPDDPQLQDLKHRALVVIDVTTSPPDARVSVRDWRKGDDAWTEVGMTPLRQVELPRGPLRIKVSRDGYDDLETFWKLGESTGVSIVLESPRDEDSGQMVWVDAGDARVGHRITESVEACVIDKHEVTNAQFQRFMREGGYAKLGWWSELRQYLSENGTATDDDLRRYIADNFLDEAGQPGPAPWKQGTFPPDERGDHPVRGVSWFEACAYANYVGKSLPTVFHWTRASDMQVGAQYIEARSNFSGEGTTPVGTYSGTGRFGALDMAGNVKEWCWNAGSDGVRHVCGGAWNDHSYMFVFAERVDPTSRDSRIGFRCAKYLGEDDARVFAEFPMRPFHDYRADQPVSEETARLLSGHYRIDHSEDLAPKHLSSSRIDTNIIHEEWTIAAAYNNERFGVHVYLPDGMKAPYQTILYFPGAGAKRTMRFSDHTGKADWLLPMEFTKRGYAVCWPIYKGTYERQASGSPSDMIHQRGKDVFRAVDFLVSQERFDKDTLTYVGFSWGGNFGPMVTAFDSPFRAAVLIDAGLFATKRAFPETEAFNFAPHVRIPVLMVNGRFDTIFPVNTSQEPLLEFLGSEDKRRIELKEGWHVTPAKESTEAAVTWLQERLGAPVRKSAHSR